MQEHAKRKAQRYQEWAVKACQRGDTYMKASNEGAEFLKLAEPIKIGHHSEKRHRALIDRNWNRIGKSVQMQKKAEGHASKAEYWEKRENTINLSMPESIDFYRYKLEKITEYHAGLKSGKYERRYPLALSYAKKEVNETRKLLDLAIKLWS